MTPGSSSGSNSFFVLLAKNQSRILPTKGEIKVTLASAQATAWEKENKSVRLHLIPSFSNCSAAFIPSQVEANLIKTLSFLTPFSSYKEIILLARLIFPSISKDNLASTSVETFFKNENGKKG